MGKNNYSGTEVYVSKLIDGTKFHVENGSWNGQFKIENGIPMLIVEDDTIFTILPDYTLNITTDQEIPKSAFVYESVYYAQLIQEQSIKLHNLAKEIKSDLLDEEKLMKVKLALRNSRDELDTLFGKFFDMKIETD